MVMVGDSQSRGSEFESRHCILEGSFITFICCNKFSCRLKKPKINEKEAEVGPLKKIISKKEFWIGRFIIKVAIKRESETITMSFHKVKKLDNMQKNIVSDCRIN